MKDLALKEANKLLSKFVQLLTVSEIQQAAYCSAGLGYAQLASSMWYRGFFAAARTSARLSIRHSFNAPLKEIILAQAILMKGVLMYSMVKPMRKILPPYLRLILKRVLLSIRRRLINPPSSPAVHAVVEQPSLPISSLDALENMTLGEKFSTVYEQNLFGGKLSHSGEGSDLVQTTIIRHEIPKLVKEFKINSMLDAPCGDWYWMKAMPLDIAHYIGVDIVEALIAKNQLTYGSDTIHFRCLNLVTDTLPKVDLIFSRDCLVHLSYEDALKMLNNFKASGATYLLTTTFTDRTHNVDLGTGFWRPLNLQLPPFHFPPPLRIINEGCTEGDNLFTDKCLGLWRLEELTLR
jgi:hypothetical protein